MARRKEAESRTGKTEPPGEGPATPH
jgi:hypothetical protein